MNKNPQKINLTSDDSLFEKSLNLQKYIEDLSSQAINLTDKFSFTWAGKSNAIKSVLVPSKLTLNPEPKQSIKWDESENLFIEGDNLEVLKLLQKAYFEKVKMIYIDPPYNTGHDFVYNDNFSAPLDNYLKQTGQKTDAGDSVSTNKETNGRYHSDWLSMMYPRLKLAWNLLREDGVIFVSIDDNEVHHLRMIMDEVFGEENFIGMFSVENNPKGRKNGKFISVTNEYCLIYAKKIDIVTFEKIIPKHASDMSEDENGDFVRKSGKRVLMGENTLNNPVSNFNSAKHYSAYIRSSELILKQEKSLDDIDKDLINKGYVRYITFNDGKFVENTYTKDKFQLLFEEGALDIRESKIYEKHFSDMMQIKSMLTNNEYEAIVDNKKIIYQIDLKTTSAKQQLIDLLGGEYFSFPKNISFIKHLISLQNDPSSIILDFFAGSASTAHAVLEKNQEDGGSRKFICVQLPEKLEEDSEGFKAGYKTISDIAKERIRRVIKGYGENPQPINDGFKVFTLSESNYPENTFVFNSEKTSEENQQAFVDYLNKAKQSQLFDKGNDTSLVYENVVKEGLSLNSKVEKVSIGKNNVYKVTDGEQQLLICLENKLATETVRELTDKSHKDKLFICLESALDDTIAANLSLNLDLKTI